MHLCNWSPKIYTSTTDQFRVYYTTHGKSLIADFMAKRERERERDENLCIKFDFKAMKTGRAVYKQ